MANQSHQTEIYTIICAILGEATSFSVKIASNEIVDQLKEAIKEKRKNTLTNIDAAQLDLYRVEIPDSEDVAEAMEQKLLGLPKLSPTKKLAGVFKDDLKEETVHIIVQLQTDPPIVARGTKRKHAELIIAEEKEPLKKQRGTSEEASDVLPPLAQADITRHLVAKWSQPTSALNLLDIRTYIQQPLAEDEKIPIRRRTFDWLSRSFEFPEHEVGAEQLATLFRVSTDEAPRAKGLFVSAIEVAPPAHGTEDLFHATWDRNISSILALILSEANPIRNSNRNTSTALQRPDYGFLVKGACVFRGEENGSDSSGNPEQELVDKLQWSYDPLPYILGYHAIATDVDFVAITAPPVKTVHLFHHDLKFKKGRVANLVHLIRLSQVMAHLDEQLHRRVRPEFLDFGREDGLVVMNVAAVVRKEFRHEDAAARVSHLVEVYNLLKRKEVPNVDKLNHYSMEENWPHVQLSPVGSDTEPGSGSEALNAVICVLEALKVMHSSPNPVYHRDIREPNIIKRFDSQGWFLIDWSDASMAPTRAVTHLKESEHSPRVRQDNHGAEVDIWGVGRYLENLASRATCGIAKPGAVQQMARRWMTDLTTSAVVALDEINANQNLFTTRGSD